MIVLIMLVYGGFYQGMTIPAIAFILGALFDLGMAELIFRNNE